MSSANFNSLPVTPSSKSLMYTRNKIGPSQACAQMRAGAFKCKCRCKRRIKCKFKCKCAAVESNASANANAQQLNQMQMQMHLDQMQMHLDQIQMHLDRMQCYFITMFFPFTSDILLNYLVTTINKNTINNNNYEYI